MLQQEFCTSEDFEGEFEAFAKENSDVFGDALKYTLNDEHPIAFHSVYSTYLEYFERKIEKFIKKVIYKIFIFLF